MAAITANLLAAVAPPVSPPPPPASESVPKSGFAQALSGAASQSQATNSTSQTNTNTTTSTTSTTAGTTTTDTTETATNTTDEQTQQDTTAQSAAAAVLAAFGLIPQQTLPTVVTTETAATATTPTPQESTTPATAPTAANESRSQDLRFLTTPAQNATATTNTTPANQTPATQQQPATTPTPAPTPTPTTPTTPAIPTTTADTTTAVRPAATNTPAVVPQTPIVVDPRQQAPVAPPEIGYGLIGPTPTTVEQVQGVPPVGAGVSQAQVELRAAALPAAEAVTIQAVPAPTVTQPFAQVLNATATATAAVIDQALAQLPTASLGTDTDIGLSPDAVMTPPMSGQPAAFPTTPTPPAATQPAATNSPPVVSQLHDAFVTHAQVVPKDGGHEFQLRLDPPELGEVKVRVVAMGDRVEARLVVSDDAVKRMIESQLPELRQKLEAAGVPVQKFDVTTGDGGRGNTGGGGWDRSQPAPTPRNTAMTASRPTALPTPSGGLIDVTA